MTLDQYLARFVEGYLFGDLRAMAAVRQSPDAPYGGVGYPMVMSALAGVELLGTLTAAAPFDSRQGHARFEEFWRQRLYPGAPRRQGMAALVYQMVRHGLAHTCMTKPRFTVTKGHDPRHLTQTAHGDIILDALALAEDLFAVYTNHVTPVLQGEGRPQVEARFREMRDWHAQEYEKHRTAFDAVPRGLVPPSKEQPVGRALVPRVGADLLHELHHECS